MARPDLTNEQVEQMGRQNPGSAAEYLRLRREELAAEAEAAREREDRGAFVREFVAAGGTQSAAKEAYRRHCNEEAEKAAVAASEAARLMTRRHVARSL
jgi:hypothetical protein